MAYSKTYTRINWQNAPSEATALNETNLNKMDSAIDTLDDRIVALDTARVNDESAISTAQGDISSLQNGKVDKETGKGLSTNDYSTDEKTKLTYIETYATNQRITPALVSGNTIAYIQRRKNATQVETIGILYIPTADSSLSSSSTNYVQNKVVTSALAGKVDVVSGKGLCAKSDVSVLPAPDEIGEEIATITLANQDNTSIQWNIYNQVEAITNAEIDALA